MDALKHADSSERTGNLALALAALAGVMGSTAVGLGLTGAGAESIPQLAAAAIPSVVAFLLSYLIYQTPALSAAAALPSDDGGLIALLPEDAERLPQGAAATGALPLPVSADAAQAVRHG